METLPTFTGGTMQTQWGTAGPLKISFSSMLFHYNMDEIPQNLILVYIN